MPEIGFPLLGLADGLVMGSFRALHVSPKDLRFLTGPIHFGVAAILNAAQVLRRRLALLGRRSLARGQMLLQLAAVALCGLKLHFQRFLPLRRLYGSVL